MFTLVEFTLRYLCHHPWHRSRRKNRTVIKDLMRVFANRGDLQGCVFDCTFAEGDRLLILHSSRAGELEK